MRKLRRKTRKRPGDHRVARFPESNVIFVVSTTDITRDDADRLWGIGGYERPDDCVIFTARPFSSGHSARHLFVPPFDKTVNDDCAAVIVGVDTQEFLNEGDHLYETFSRYFVELYNACVAANVRYLMVDRDAGPVRARPLWKD